MDLLMQLHKKHNITGTRNPSVLKNAWQKLTDEYNAGMTSDGIQATFTKKQLTEKIKNYKKSIKDKKSTSLKSFKKTGMYINIFNLCDV